MLHNIFIAKKFFFVFGSTLPNKIGVNNGRKEKKRNWHILTAQLLVLCWLLIEEMFAQPMVKEDMKRIKTLNIVDCLTIC